MESGKSTESSATNNMFSVVKQMNAGYEKFFDSKPKASGIRSECYSNYKACGTTSNCVPTTQGRSTLDGSDSENNSLPVSANGQGIVQQFFPRDDEPKQCQPVNGSTDEAKQCQRVFGSGCSKYLSVKSEKM